MSVRINLASRRSDERIISVANNLLLNSEWFISRICNLSTINREFQAIQSVSELKLSELLLNPSLYMENRKHVDYFNIPLKLEKKLNLFFNESQLIALKSSIKKKGLTLIQGPPGTGKSTTILGILSVILNTETKKESVQRSRSFYDDVEEDCSGLNNREYFLSKSNPWLYNSNYKNWMDTPIDHDEKFTAYPNSTETDAFKKYSIKIEDNTTSPEKILVCAPSNVAIDEIVRKIIQTGLIDAEGNNYNPKFIRIGPNYHSSIKEYSMDYIMSTKLNSNDGDKDKDKIKSDMMANVKIICSTLSMAGSTILTSLNQVRTIIILKEIRYCYNR